MKSIKDFLAPLGYFVVGMGMLLFLFLWLSSIGAATDDMASATVAESPTVAATIWGWSWFSQGAVVKMIVVLLSLGVILFGVAKAWLRSRYTR